ncbi:unnamed protein product, partial [marine sediment metagenome]
NISIIITRTLEIQGIKAMLFSVNPLTNMIYLFYSPLIY